MSSWQLVKLGTITTKVGSGATPRGGKDSYKAAGVPLIRSQNVHFDGFRDDGLAFLDDDQAEALRSVEVHAEDVLLNITGASIGRVTTAPTRMSGARVNQHVCIIRPKSELRPSFLSWYLASPNIQHFIFDIQTGVTRQALTKEQILAFEVPLPPVDIQDKIVAEIEKQFSRLDEAVTAMKRIQANLKRYKAAVLKAAVEGKLTEQWRKEHHDVEPADQLLKHILAERRAKWEAEELAKMKAKGIKPKDDSWKKKYKEPAGPDMVNLPELPGGWVWASPIQLDSGEAYATAIGPFGSNLKVSDYRSEGVPLVFVRNIRSNIFSGVETKYVSDDKSQELRPHWVRPGDVLVTKMGDPPGDATSYPEGFPIAVITADCIKMTLSPTLEKHRSFVIHAINSEVIKRQITDITQGVAQQKISLGRFAQIGIPLPPLKEQVVILEELDRRLSVTEELEATIETNLKRAERLRQTILQQAFSGGLAV